MPASYDKIPQNRLDDYLKNASAAVESVGQRNFLGAEEQITGKQSRVIRGLRGIYDRMVNFGSGGEVDQGKDVLSFDETFKIRDKNFGNPDARHDGEVSAAPVANSASGASPKPEFSLVDRQDLTSMDALDDLTADDIDDAIEERLAGREPIHEEPPQTPPAGP